MTSRSSVADRVIVAGPAGELEVLREVPEGPLLRGVAMICHPHPLHGGTMDNKVVHSLARAFLDCRFAAIRFNFRGVGRSAGVYGDGIGEAADARAVADWIRRKFPDQPLSAAGFSFGAAVAYSIASDPNLQALVTIAPPVSRLPVSRAQPDCPWLVVHGDQDELIDIDSVLTWINALDPGPELVVLEGATHFFHGKLTELRDTVTQFVDRLPRDR